jgi:N-methylhydantoinase B/oxoprolinase/acetone carboxylase alpha subunit
MNGGMPGLCGRNLLVKQGGLIINIGGRCSTSIDIGERLRIETPSGGGYGNPSS